MPAIRSAARCLLILTVTALTHPAGADNWPQWRGPLASGVAPDGNPPTTWGEPLPTNTYSALAGVAISTTSGVRNIRWKTELPGYGVSSPIIWQDRVILTTAVDTGRTNDLSPTAEDEMQKIPDWQRRMQHASKTVQQFVAMAVDRKTGTILWRQTLAEEVPHEGHHNDASWASPSPVTDGTNIIASFGSRGLFGMDMNGNVLWQKNLGNMSIKNRFGEGASPVLAGDKVIVNWDHEGPSFITALDKTTGREIWRTQRDEMTSWATPLVVAHAGPPQIIVSATRHIRSYSAADGKLIWECGGMTINAIPSPVATGTRVFLMSGFRGSALLAIDLTLASGDLSAKPHAIVWTYGKDTSYVPSPLLCDGWLYFIKVNDNALTCLDAQTGKDGYKTQSLPGISGIYASPVAAAGRIYIAGRNGLTYVIRQGPAFEVLARNGLDDNFTASPAIAGKDLILRGAKHLYCIAE